MKSSVYRLFLLLVSCFIFSKVTTAQSGDSLLAQLSGKWMNAKMYTLKIAGLMPKENYAFKPVAEVMSFKEQLLHMAGNMQWLSASFLLSNGSKQVKDTAKMDKAAVLKYISDVYDQAYTAHKKLRQKQLDEVVPFLAGPMTRRQNSDSAA